MFNKADLKANSLIVIVVLLYAFAVFVIFRHYELLDYYRLSIYSSMLYLSLINILLIKAVVYFIRYTRRPIKEKGIKVITNDFMTRATDKNYLINIAVPMMVLPPFFSLFSATKSNIHRIHDFTWDKTFMTIDKMLHFGVDPWKITFAIFGGTYATLFLNFIYNVWFGVMFFFVLWMIVSVDYGKIRFQFLLTFLLTWIVIGSVLAIIFSSAGPVYYGRITGDNSVFEPLMALLKSINDPLKDNYFYIYALDTQEYLWDAYKSAEVQLGTGISAMPSMHLAIASLLYFTARELNRKAGYIFLVYLILIEIGSIHLGWHYAIDGYVSIILTWLMWIGAKVISNRIFEEKEYRQ
ncbi:MAG: phosphatase PAP2 family protein [Alphaproteobacteria bacterium]|nr:phosphatase PAP2 family protein [Alphaproteobacteria bacterium]HRW29748.1 phosphatase PAP2 family protein [Emcibacteraceae bacterium]